MELQAPPKRRKKGTYLLPGLGRLRREHGYSMRGLAEEAGLGLDTVWRLETLQRGAESRSRRELARVLKTTIKELKTPDEEANGSS